MKLKSISIGILSCAALTGCAGLKFNGSTKDDALTYFEVEPYFFVSTTKDCVTTATVVALPGKKRSVSLESGYGSANLTVSLTSGMISSVGQNTDTKVPETLTTIGGLATAGILAAGEPAACKPTANLYRIIDGKVSDQPANNFPVSPHRTRGCSSLSC